MRNPFGLHAVVALLLICGGSIHADDLEQRASWSVPEAAKVRASMLDWLKEQDVDELTRLKVETLWPAEGADESVDVLTRVGEVLAVADDAARQLIDQCQGAETGKVLKEFKVLTDEDTPALMRNNLRLIYARWLAQHNLADECREQLEGLTPTDVVDPASLLFYQSVVWHRLLEKEKCLDAIGKLLENEDEIPRRYNTVARLMEADMKPLKKDSLDEVARLMADIRRRLDLGRAGQRVRKQEDEVIAKLDKMIDEMEKQQQQQQQQQGGGQGQSGGPPSNPADRATPGGVSGPGEVDPRDIGNRSGWGNLPAKDRQEALQQISKDLPAHYREVIEEYFRKIAAESR